VSFELRPAREPVETRDLELRIGERCCRAGLEQVLGLVLQVAEIRTVGKRAWRLLWISRHSSFRPIGRCPHNRAERRLLRLKTESWLLPFPRTRCVLHATAILSWTSQIRQRPAVRDKGVGRLRRIAGATPYFGENLAGTVAGNSRDSERITAHPELSQRRSRHRAAPPRGTPRIGHRIGHRIGCPTRQAGPRGRLQSAAGFANPPHKLLQFRISAHVRLSRARERGAHECIRHGGGE
jgi:hypothetical protein